MSRAPLGGIAPGIALGLLALAGAGCASTPSAAEGPATLPALPAGEPATRPPTSSEAALQVAHAARTGARPEAYALTLRMLEHCGTRPLGQQALLLLAAAELDPRNPDARLSLAREAVSLVAEASEPDAWTRVLAESLYLMALRLGAPRATAGAGPEAELRLRARRPNGHPVVASAGTCDALPWPNGRAEEPGDLPGLDGASYPARIAWLQRRVSELEAELKRLRRITTGQP